jgi:hypothetical protein
MKKTRAVMNGRCAVLQSNALTRPPDDGGAAVRVGGRYKRDLQPPPPPSALTPLHQAEDSSPPSAEKGTPPSLSGRPGAVAKTLGSADRPRYPARYPGTGYVLRWPSDRRRLVHAGSAAARPGKIAHSTQAVHTCCLLNNKYEGSSRQLLLLFAPMQGSEAEPTTL